MFGSHSAAGEESCAALRLVSLEAFGGVRQLVWGVGGMRLIIVDFVLVQVKSTEGNTRVSSEKKHIIVSLLHVPLKLSLTVPPGIGLTGKNSIKHTISQMPLRLIH